MTPSQKKAYAKHYYGLNRKRRMLSSNLFRDNTYEPDPIELPYKSIIKMSEEEAIEFRGQLTLEKLNKKVK